MTNARLDGLYLLLLGCAIFLLLGSALERNLPSGSVDFKSVYYGARCLLQHSDPYKTNELLRVIQENGDGFTPNLATSPTYRQGVYICINSPSTLVLIAPLALLAWGPAHILWLTLTASSFILASFLMWQLSADRAPLVSAGLICYMLASSELLLTMGNTAGIAVSFCMIAVWCFFKERYIPAGVFCLAISLLLKPHDSAFVWLYFLLAGGVYRKRAVQTLAAAVALGIPAIVWVTSISPRWMQEMAENISATSAYGNINDPGPASLGSHGLAMIINLQAIFSVFTNDPHVYNSLSYVVCGIPLLAWAIITGRSRATPAKACLALAAIAALSMLPVYHRQSDAKLLVLTVPACALLWSEGGRVGRMAVLVTASGFVLTGELPWAVFLAVLNKLPPATTFWYREVLIGVQVFPAPLILLTMAAFYLWAYTRRCSPAFSQEL